MSTRSVQQTLPYLVMILSPLFFSTNLVLGRYLAGDISPFVLAAIRWGLVAMILCPLVFGSWTTFAAQISMHLRLLFVLGFLGMCVCGGGVYLGLKYTTATNATLIYTVSPVLIVLIERFLHKRRSSLHEIFGVMVALAGVIVIVLRGTLATALTLTFNIGDILIFAAAASWAAYSVVYRADSLRRVNNMQLLGLIAMLGALCNLPFALIEIAQGDALPARVSSWMVVGGIVLFPSLLAYSTYQYGVRMLGPAVTGIFMYLLAPYGVILAVLFLREALLPFHLVGIALVMTGVVLATFPRDLLRNIFGAA